VDLGTALLLFMVLGRQWLLLPGLALETGRRGQVNAFF